MKNTVLITLGDPNGIGPEIICKLLSKKRFKDSSLVIIGPEKVLNFYCSLLGIKKFWEKLNKIEDISKGIFVFFPEDTNFTPTPSIPTISSAQIAAGCLEIACELIKNKKSKAIVTCPLNKAYVLKAGYKNFYGHTEFLAKRFGLKEDDICMHLFCSKIKVSLVTTHIPLKEVYKHITIKKILTSLDLTWKFVKKMEPSPQPIGVCGLNPHAGEDGKIGIEEQKVIIPAIEEAQKKGIKANGPFSADTIFYRALQKEFSAILAMYHDQGLGPLKSICFKEAVNITLGLPFIRTSVGHGTGYDIVGKNKASTESLEQAIKIALALIIR